MKNNDVETFGAFDISNYKVACQRWTCKQDYVHDVGQKLKFAKW